MNPLKRLAQSVAFPLADWAVRQRPRLFLDALERADPDLVVRSINPPDDFSWDALAFGSTLTTFEELLPLFFLSPTNRGLMRLDFDEALLINRRVSALTAPRGVEIGRFNGGSTLMLALAIGSLGQLTSIDIAPRADAALSQRLSQFGLSSRVRLLIADANSVEATEPLDFVFIDGDHSYDGAKKDHERWTPRLKPGGVAFYHDMASARPRATQIDDLKRLRQDILSRDQATLELIEEVGSISVFRRR